MKNRINNHEIDYKPKAWKNYSINELGMWVHLFTERATHRKNKDKLKKDLYDAKNYLWMIEQKLRSRCKELDINFEDL